MTNKTVTNNVFWLIVCNVLRWIPNILFGFIYFAVYLIIPLFKMKKMKSNIAKWKEAVKSEDSLINFFKTTYKYKYDEIGGIADHDSFWLEWFCGFGDCDDAALYSKKALKKLGYKAFRIGLIGMGGMKNSHFDCAYYKTLSDGTKIYKMFNYGNPIEGNSLENVLENFGIRYTRYNKKSLKWCKLFY